LVKWFRELGAEEDDVVWIEPKNLARAATLLEQLSTLAPVVVPLKERPDFIAGYRAGLVDNRFLAAEEQAQRRDAHVSSFPLPQAGEGEA
jgi:hypothetical protein